MIYLNAEIISWLWEDTFWTWFKREFPNSSFETPKKLNDGDILLRYSTLGFLPIKWKQLAICWELYPDMKNIFSTDQWDARINKVNETAKYSTYRTVPTKHSLKFYEWYWSVDIIPIWVDTDIFKPFSNKWELRKKYNLPKDKKIGIWVWTMHPMKWYEELLNYSDKNPDIYWIIISKEKWSHIKWYHNYTKIPQQQIAELISASDFFLSTSKLSPYYMAEREAMSCNIPFIIIWKENREFIPWKNPRDDVFKYWWDRKSCKKQWENYFLSKSIKW